MSENTTELSPGCDLCGRTEMPSRAMRPHWLYISGVTAEGHPEGDGVQAQVLLCGTCVINHAYGLATFIDGLAPGWTSVKDDELVVHIK